MFVQKITLPNIASTTVLFVFLLLFFLPSIGPNHHLRVAITTTPPTTLSRVTSSLRGSFPTMLTTLPDSTGPYILGVSDIEVGPILVRLFYPCRLSPAPLSHEPRPSWLITMAYARGYGDFLKVPAVISIPIFGALFSGLKIPRAIQDAPLAAGPREGETGEARLPLVVFSHGLGGMRTTYSAICANMASHGFMVACVEHRDSSASLTFRNDHQEPVAYQRLPVGADEFEFRNNQVKYRVDEVVRYVFSTQMNRSRDKSHAAPNPRKSELFPL